MAVSYEPWEFYRGPNRELSRARIVVGSFSGSVVSSPSTSQRLGEPQQERPSEPISEEPREERIGFVVPEIPDADSASSEVSDSEDDHPQTKPVKTGIVYSRSVKDGWVNLDNISKTASAVNAPKTQPKQQSKFTQPASRRQATGKDNKEQRSWLPCSATALSDSEDDKPVPIVVRKKVVKELRFGDSPVQRSALAVKQAKGINKNSHDPTSHNKQRSSSTDHKAKLRWDYASHQEAVSWCT